MPRKSTNYREGDCFAVPLRSGGYARGVVARANGMGGVFGYFFGPRLDRIEEVSVDTGLAPTRAILASRFGDLGLLRGEWKIVGRVAGWDRRSWPMPPFVRVDEIADKAWIARYDEDTFAPLSEEPADPALAGKYPPDRDAGYGAIEIRLTNLLT